MFRMMCLLLAVLGAVTAATMSEVSVTTVDFLPQVGVEVNAAGPVLVKVDADRNRILVANTLSSSVSMIDGQTHALVNISIGGRALQHLKAEAMAISRRTGDMYLVGARAFHIIHPDSRTAETIPTNVQFEAVAVDENSGNAFITGRESGQLGFYEARSRKLTFIKWLEHEERLINLNQTPPPPIRKLVVAPELQRLIAIDGFSSTLYLFDAKNGKQIAARQLALTNGGRWHLAGYNEQTHRVFIVVETTDRRVIEAASIDILNNNDMLVKLPEYTEGVGILYHPGRDEVYIPYDNHPAVHVVDFRNVGTVEEIKLPAYGNDASALDVAHDILYIGSWAHGEVDVIDLASRKLEHRIENLGIIPHMFSLAFNPNTGLLYVPKGASAVNGTFGAALNVLDPSTEEYEKIRLGWAPIDLIEIPGRSEFLVFGNEDQYAVVRPEGTLHMQSLPFDYPVMATSSSEGHVYLSYGPHQSYWPVVYIWGAKNGVLTIDADDLSYYDRRIPRQAHRIVLDKKGTAYFTQNNWGNEEQFLGTLSDEIRLFEPGQRIALQDTVVREITQRILEYDASADRLYLVRVGENDTDPSILQAVDPGTNKVVGRVPVGLSATDLTFDDASLYVANFASNSISVVDKKDFAMRAIPTGEGPLKLCPYAGKNYVINHLGNSIQEVKEDAQSLAIPYRGYPDNLFVWKDQMVITSHNERSLFVILFDPQTESFSLLHQQDYPYGETRFDSGNVSFHVNGQFGDALFSLTQDRIDHQGRLWMTDFLSGKVFIFEVQ